MINSDFSYYFIYANNIYFLNYILQLDNYYVVYDFFYIGHVVYDYVCIIEIISNFGINMYQPTIHRRTNS